MEIIANTITEAYVKILDALVNYGIMRESRIGTTIELIDTTIVIKNPRTRKIIEPLRKQNLHYIAKEIDWYLSGSYDAEPMERAAKVWKMIKDPSGKVNSNYGAKIFHTKINGKSQFDRVIEHLRKFPNSRRAIFFFNLYPDDWIQMDETKDYVCTIYGHAIINQGKLDLLIYMRSNDVIWGWGNDVPFFTLLQEMMSVKLGVPMGVYRHHAGSLHIYKRHFYKLEGRHFSDFDVEKETPFPPLTEEDVDALLRRDYTIDTPFMKVFKQYLRSK